MQLVFHLSKIIYLIDNIEILDKHQNNSNEFVTLFLSNLIESKGYLVYLDALIILSVMLEQKNINIYSILAGKLLNNEKDKLNKIEEIQLRLSQVNNSKNISTKEAISILLIPQYSILNLINLKKR